MSDTLEVTSIWQSVRHGHCAYRTSAPSGERVCKHPFALTMKCIFSDCPIALPKYVGLNREENSIYMLEKDSSRPFAEMWKEREISGERSEVEKLLSSYPEKMQERALAKFESLLSIVSAITEHLGEEDAYEENTE